MVVAFLQTNTATTVAVEGLSVTGYPVAGLKKVFRNFKLCWTTLATALT